MSRHPLHVDVGALLPGVLCVEGKGCPPQRHSLLRSPWTGRQGCMCPHKDGGVFALGRVSLRAPPGRSLHMVLPGAVRSVLLCEATPLSRLSESVSLPSLHPRGAGTHLLGNAGQMTSGRPRLWESPRRCLLQAVPWSPGEHTKLRGSHGLPTEITYMSWCLAR